ncbi:MAG: L-glyceraldehyde 3-phosphate reductase [Acidobacteriota bacterium]|jgi:L-glyceraldehyde 3-phosphate reductase
MSYLASDNRYDCMPYRRCGRSGLRLPIVSLGLWHNFGGVDVYETGREIVLDAFDQGITHFDLANNYGPPPGSAEETLGRILRKDLHSYRDELIISTKAGYTMWPGPYGDWGSRKYLTASLDQSLKRMGLDYVDIFYSHRPDPETALEETMGALHLAVQQGKALYAGISNYPVEQTVRAADILQDLGTRCLIHQARYSMLDRWVEKSLLDVLVERGIGCIAFSPLAQGLLTDRYFDRIPQDSRAAKPHGFLGLEQVSPEVVHRSRRLAQIAADRAQSLAQMALSWLLRTERVTSVVVGVSRVEQLRQNLSIMDHLEFNETELLQIEQILQTQPAVES